MVVACCRVGGTECSSACMGPFEEGSHYLHYLHHIWPKVKNREGTQPHPSTENWIKDILRREKDVLSIIGDRNAKVGSQETPGVTGKFGLGVQNEAGQRLIEFCQENTLVIANTLFQQHKRQLYTWTSPDGQH